MSEEGRFTIRLEHLEGYELRVKFDWDDVDDLLLDEPPPLGRGAGPNAARILAAAVANCLSASLLYCITKGTAPPASLQSEVTCRIVRNEQQRLRVGSLDVRIKISEAMEEAARTPRCLDLFEDFCVVTGSIRQGIPVRVTVVNARDQVLHVAE
jgi:organic hydroperoxide reductase OsmC/OhrA